MTPGCSFSNTLTAHCSSGRLYWFQWANCLLQLLHCSVFPLFPSRSQESDWCDVSSPAPQALLPWANQQTSIPTKSHSLTEIQSILQPWAMACPEIHPSSCMAEHVQCWSHFLTHTSLQHAGLLSRSAGLMWSLLTSCGLSLLWILSFLNLSCKVLLHEWR